MRIRGHGAHGARRGAAILVAIIATIVLSGLAVSMIAVSGARQHESEANSQRLRALYAAEAGVAENIAAQRKGVVRDFGERQAPIQFSGGAYYSSAVDNGDNTTTVQSFATVDSASVGIEAVVLKQGETNEKFKLDTLTSV